MEEEGSRKCLLDHEGMIVAFRVPPGTRCDLFAELSLVYAYIYGGSLYFREFPEGHRTLLKRGRSGRGGNSTVSGREPPTVAWPVPVVWYYIPYYDIAAIPSLWRAKEW